MRGVTKNLQPIYAIQADLFFPQCAEGVKNMQGAYLPIVVVLVQSSHQHASGSSPLACQWELSISMLVAMLDQCYHQHASGSSPLACQWQAGLHIIFSVWYPKFFPKNLSYETRDCFYKQAGAVLGSTLKLKLGLSRDYNVRCRLFCLDSNLIQKIQIKF